MRNITLGLLATLALSGAALADVSTSVDYDTATMSVTSSGAYGQAVSFSVPSTTLQLDSKLIRPGATYDVKVPVTNPTDRTITVSVTGATPGGSGASLVTATPVVSTVDIAPGAMGELSYTVSISDTKAVAETSGKTVSVTFDLQGTSQE